MFLSQLVNSFTHMNHDALPSFSRRKQDRQAIPDCHPESRDYRWPRRQVWMMHWYHWRIDYRRYQTDCYSI